MYFVGKYGVQTTFYFAMVKRAVVDLAASADWTPATGDTKISKDGGALANTTNNPTVIASSVIWSLTLTATEMQAATINIQIIDSATKTVEDQFLTVYTYGNASGKFPFDYSDVTNGHLNTSVAAYGAGLQPELPIRNATAQGGSANSITLDASASATDGLYDPSIILIRSGTGAGQSRIIIQYTGSTKVAIVDRSWRTNPDNTSVYEIYSAGNLRSVNEGLAQGGGASTITLNAQALATDNIYNGQLIILRGGTGSDQARIITGYVGSTKVATVGRAWDTAPDNTTTYMMVQASAPKVDSSLRTTDVNSANLDAAITSRASQTSVNTIDDFIDTEIADIQSRLPAALISGRMSSVIGAVTGGVIDSASLASDMNTYQAKVWVFDDNSGANDRYVTIWHKNGQPITAGITIPTIQIIKVSDGSDLVASTAMTQIASTGLYRYSESSNRIVSGTAYVAKVEATIDGSTRTWYQPVGRDS